jgi:hypothetical protein
VEYKGTIPAPDIEKIRAALEAEANRLVSAGGQVYFFIFPPNFSHIDYVILSKFLYLWSFVVMMNKVKLRAFEVLIKINCACFKWDQSGYKYPKFLTSTWSYTMCQHKGT